MLRNRDDIVIKPADKGSAVVIMDKANYIAEAVRQLSDERFYYDPTSEFSSKIITALQTMYDDGHIDACELCTRKVTELKSSERKLRNELVRLQNVFLERLSRADKDGKYNKDFYELKEVQ